VRCTPAPTTTAAAPACAVASGPTTTACAVASARALYQLLSTSAFLQRSTRGDHIPCPERVGVRLGTNHGQRDA
jgi:hypothetical protein